MFTCQSSSYAHLMLLRETVLIFPFSPSMAQSINQHNPRRHLLQTYVCPTIVAPFYKVLNTDIRNFIPGMG